MAQLPDNALGAYLAVRNQNQRAGFEEQMGLAGLMLKQQAIEQASTDRRDALATAAADRKAARELGALQFAATMDARREALEQRRDDALARATDKAAQDAINNQFRAQSLVLQQQNSAFQQYLAQQGLDLKKLMAGQGKPLPPKLQSDLIESGKILDSSERFTSTFKPEYGGFISDIAGNAALQFERKNPLGQTTDRAQWWQDYELHQSVVRNKLFGSALTAPEIAAWERSAITPGMNANQIKANLARRETIERTGLTRLARSSGTQYNKTAIEEAIGRPIPERDAPPAPAGAPASTGGNRLRFDANGNLIQQ